MQRFERLAASRIVGLAVAVCVVGCGRSDGAAGKAPDAAKPAATAPAPAAKPVARMVTGRVLGEDGKPVTVDGAKYSVAVTGISSVGEKVGYVPPVAADGTWKVKLVDGTFHRPKAKITVPYEKTALSYDLVPSAADGDFEAADGLVCDFTWKIRGAKPGVDAPDPANWTNYFGGQQSLVFDQLPKYTGGKGFAHLPPDGAKVRFTAEPLTKLIDGSDGKTMTYELVYDAKLFKNVKPAALHDMPIARYKVTAVLLGAGGAATPLLVRYHADEEYGESTEVTFGAYAGVVGGPPIGAGIWWTLKK